MTAPCPICAVPTTLLGERPGRHVARTFVFRACPSCRYFYVENPLEDLGAIYDERYYRGQGADPLLDYVTELDHPERTVRRYEWQGIAKVIASLVDLRPERRWLDFGCGNGGLVRHVAATGAARIEGFEEGWVAERARERGIPILRRDQLAARTGGYDVVTAIEVLEHIPDPVAALREIRALLRPGGLLFLTTGNAAPHRRDVLAWPYVIPEIHVSFFEPSTLATALTRAGFRPEVRARVPGFGEILRFKILKNLGVKERSVIERMMPWPVLSYAADRRYRISAHPIGWAV